MGIFHDGCEHLNAGGRRDTSGPTAIQTPVPARTNAAQPRYQPTQLLHQLSQPTQLLHQHSQLYHQQSLLLLQPTQLLHQQFQLLHQQSQLPISQDILSYVNRVKFTYASQPQVYEAFMVLLEELKSQRLDVPRVIVRVLHLFKGQPELIAGFSAFLPPVNEIKVHANDRVKVPTNQSVRFNAANQHAYVNKIKSRFHGQADVYKQFLKVLRNYQKEQRNLKKGNVSRTKPVTKTEVYKQAEDLFKNHEDLLLELDQFLSENTIMHSDPAKKSVKFNSGNQRVNVNPDNNDVAIIDFLIKVKNRFQGRSEIYSQFMELLGTFQTEKHNRINGIPTGTKPLTEADVYQRVAILFQNQMDLIEEFSQFLSNDFNIHLNLAKQQVEFNCSNQPEKFNPPSKSGDQPIPVVLMSVAAVVTQSQPQPETQVQPYQPPPQSQAHLPLHADLPLHTIPSAPPAHQPWKDLDPVTYVNKVKKRFQWQPRVFEHFLELLNTSHNLKMGITTRIKPLTEEEVYVRVAEMFQNHRDLLREFKQFAPGAILTSKFCDPKPVVGFSTFHPPVYENAVTDNGQASSQTTTIIDPMPAPSASSHSITTLTSPKSDNRPVVAVLMPAAAMVAQTRLATQLPFQAHGSPLSSADLSVPTLPPAPPVKDHSGQVIVDQFLELVSTFQAKKLNLVKEIATGTKPLTKAQMYQQVVRLLQNQKDIMREFQQFLSEVINVHLNSAKPPRKFNPPNQPVENKTEAQANDRLSSQTSTVNHSNSTTSAHSVTKRTSRKSSGHHVPSTSKVAQSQPKHATRLRPYQQKPRSLPRCSPSSSADSSVPTTQLLTPANMYKKVAELHHDDLMQKCDPNIPGVLVLQQSSRKIHRRG